MKRYLSLIIITINMFYVAQSNAMVKIEVLCQPSESANETLQRDYVYAIQQLVLSLLNINDEVSRNAIYSLSNDDRQLLAALACDDENDACHRFAKTTSLFSNEGLDTALLLAMRLQSYSFVCALLSRQADRIHARILGVAMNDAINRGSLDIVKLFTSDRAIFNRFGVEFINGLLQLTRQKGDKEAEAAMMEAIYRRACPLCAIL